jgi:hypothetical protein
MWGERERKILTWPQLTRGAHHILLSAPQLNSLNTHDAHSAGGETVEKTPK